MNTRSSRRFKHIFYITNCLSLSLSLLFKMATVKSDWMINKNRGGYVIIIKKKNNCRMYMYIEDTHTLVDSLYYKNLLPVHGYCWVWRRCTLGVRWQPIRLHITTPPGAFLREKKQVHSRNSELNFPLLQNKAVSLSLSLTCAPYRKLHIFFFFFIFSTIVIEKKGKKVITTIIVDTGQNYLSIYSLHMPTW